MADRKKTEVTATSAAYVRCWIETTEHHIQRIHPRKVGFIQLIGYHNVLNIDSDIWAECKTKASDRFDNRMFRWDHAAELESL